MVATAERREVLTRDQVPVEDTWDLSDLYEDDAAWDADAAQMDDLLATVAAHRGMLTMSASALAIALDDAMAARLTMERLQVYAALRRDENTTDAAALTRYERATRLAVTTGETLAFIEPELSTLHVELLEALAANPILKRYTHLLDDLIRRRPHVRSLEIEELLAQSSDVARAASEAFSALDNADLTFGSVRDEDGREIELTKGRYNLLLERRDRGVRRAAHETLSQAYLDHQHTIASLHAASVRKDAYYASVRNYPSARASALFDTNVPESVYDSLITAVREAEPARQRFMRVRAKALQIDDVSLYDLRVPLAATPERSYTYQDATEIVLDGLDPLGARYVDDLAGGFGSRWVDVQETKGKRSGAYSWGAYGAHPVILMNWNGTLSDVFTLAHEAGHAMHSFYADQAQPFHDAGYPIFLAEIASTVNEILLTWHMLEQTAANDALGRFDLLNRFADEIHGTLVTQAMYAAFEHRTHELVEAGEPLTLEVLSTLFGELQAEFLPGLVVDDLAKIRWARIPHFYRAFYVYQYATGISAAITLAGTIRDEGTPAAERYLELLVAGGSDYPLVLLQKAGVDMTSPDPVRTALQEYDRVLTEMERMIDADEIPITGAESS